VCAFLLRVCLRAYVYVGAYVCVSVCACVFTCVYVCVCVHIFAASISSHIAANEKLSTLFCMPDTLGILPLENAFFFVRRKKVACTHGV